MNTFTKPDMSTKAITRQNANINKLTCIEHKNGTKIFSLYKQARRKQNKTKIVSNKTNNDKNQSQTKQNQKNTQRHKEKNTKQNEKTQ